MVLGCLKIPLRLVEIRNGAFALSAWSRRDQRASPARPTHVLILRCKSMRLRLLHGLCLLIIAALAPLTASAVTMANVAEPATNGVVTTVTYNGVVRALSGGDAAVGDYVSMSPDNFSDDHRGLGDSLTFGSCTITQDLLTANNTVLGTTDFQIQTLAPREKVTCTASYTVVQADIENLQ